MTLNLLTQVPEGLVMLSDSMASANETVGNEIEHVSFEHARKLFHLGDTLPAAAMINGAASIGSSPVGQLLRDASRELTAHNGPIDHETCVAAIVSRISAAYDAFIADMRKNIAEHVTADQASLAEINAKRATNGQAAITSVTPEMVEGLGLAQEQPGVEEFEAPALTVIVASYFSTEAASELRWPGAESQALLTGSGADIWWWGSGGEPLTRLITGVDEGRLSFEAENDAAAAAALKYLESKADRFAMHIDLDAMPVQEAIYLSEYLARVAAGYDRFQVGPHRVGGEMDVVALVDCELKWIHKQRLISSLDEQQP